MQLLWAFRHAACDSFWIFLYLRQSEWVLEARAFLYAFLFLWEKRLTSRLHHDWLKRVDVYLEETCLLTLSMHFRLNVDHEVSIGVSV